MHRGAYKGRKFGRERDQRRALLKGLASALIDNGSIETTLPKAKEVVPYVEKLITKAKVGTLHARRQVISKVAHKSSANKLVDELAPKLKGRNSGHLRIEKTRTRRGDNAQMAQISFVDDLTEAPVSKKADAPKKTATKKETAKKSPAKKPAAPKAKTASAGSRVSKASSKAPQKKTERKV